MANDCRSDFDFSYKGKIPIRLLEGFSVPEEHGRWTDGHLAKLSCSNDGAPIKQIKLYFSPFVFGELKSQRLSVFLDNNLLGDYEIGNLRADSNPLVVIIPETIKSKRYTLIFKIPDAKSPKEVGFNEDDRKLGFNFKRIIFE